MTIVSLRVHNSPSFETKSLHRSPETLKGNSKHCQMSTMSLCEDIIMVNVSIKMVGVKHINTIFAVVAITQL